ncbi:sigma-70 family RNA polymerase sigma factor [Desulfomarina sp.]
MNRKKVQDPFLNLLKKTAKKDRDAFQALYEGTNRQISVYLYRFVQDQNSVEDILVEVYTEVWKNSARFRQQSKVLTWMIGIARNLALKESRKQKYHDDIDTHPEIVGKEVDFDNTNRKEILTRALNCLSQKHREVLDLAFYQELPYQEIAQLLSIPESTVKSRIFYAKADLKKILEKMGVDRDVI